jgi:threonine dehydratase
VAAPTISRLSLERIARAPAVIDPAFLDSPQFHAEPLDAVTGAHVVVKVETVNPIRCFKGRGAEHFMTGLPAARGEQLVCASAGNFGQAMAYAGRKRGIPVTVFAAENANPLKLQRMRELGARVELAGSDFDAAKGFAREHARRHGARFVEDGREVEIAEGAGTMALELLRAPLRYDAMVVPLGNGALVTGIGAWVKHHAPSTRVVAVAARGAPAMEHSWRTGTVVPEILEDLRATVDEVLLVDDDSMIRATRLVFNSLGLLVETAGVAGLAAVLQYPERFRDQWLATPLCGGNLTAEQRAQYLA